MKVQLNSPYKGAVFEMSGVIKCFWELRVPMKEY